MTIAKNIEILLPVFNEEKNIQKIFFEINNLNLRHTLKLHFIDDGSTDNTWREIQKLKNNNVKGTKFTRNFGKDNAILAGILESDVDYIIIMDADFQHPPKYIEALIIEITSKNLDIVTARKINYQNNFFKNIYYNLFRSLTKIDLKYNSDFKIFNKKVINYLKSINETNFFLRGMIEWSGFKSSYINFEVGKRFSGNSKYNLFNLFKFGFDLILSYSTLPIRFITFIGFILLFFSSIFMIRVFYLKFFSDITDGFTSLISILLIFFSFLIISIGLVGEYIGKIYTETKSRPRYIIDEKF